MEEERGEQKSADDKDNPVNETQFNENEIQQTFYGLQNEDKQYYTSFNLSIFIWKYNLIEVVFGNAKSCTDINSLTKRFAEKGKGSGWNGEEGEERIA